MYICMSSKRILSYMQWNEFGNVVVKIVASGSVKKFLIQFGNLYSRPYKFTDYEKFVRYESHSLHIHKQTHPMQIHVHIFCTYTRTHMNTHTDMNSGM